MPDYIGQQIGDYIVLQRLGQGSFAEVYLGQHVQLGIQAAVKVLHMSLLKGDVERFLHEARVIKGLQHPHIVQVWEFAVQQGVPFLVMDYAPNGSLRDRHPKGERVELSMVVSYAKQVAEALQYAHDRKIIHRDVKPENVLLRDEGDILLSDFGLAVMSHATASLLPQGVAGTPAYMAPEQFRQLPRPASDQYALGVMVYEWLCGTCPFQGNLLELRRQHMWLPLPSLREKVPSIAPEVEQVVLKALAKDPKQRFESVQAFALALEQAAYKGITPTLETSLSSREPFSDQLLGDSSATASRSNLSTDQSLGDSQGTALLSSLSEDQLEEGSQPTPPLSGLSASRLMEDSQAITLFSSFSADQPSGDSGVTVSLSNPSADQLPEDTEATVLPSMFPIPSAPLILQAGPSPLSSHQALITPSPVQTPAGMSSRRKVMIGLVLAGACVVGGGAVLIGRHFLDQASPTPTPAPTPVIIPPGTLIFTYSGHRRTVNTVTWSPNGRRIASGSDDHTVQVWNATNGNNLFKYTGHTNLVEAVVWSPDGKRIVSGSFDRTVQVWDAADGNHIFIYKGHTEPIEAVAWSPNGGYIASGSYDQTVQVWSATNGSSPIKYTGHTDLVKAVTWSPDSKRIASGSFDKTVQVWDAANGNQILVYKGHADRVEAVAWSPDGKRIASCGNDGTVQVWNATDGSNLFKYKGHQGLVNAVAWSPDGKRIASGGLDHTVQVWNAADGSNAFSYKGHSSEVKAVAWSPDGTLIASATVDNDDTVQVWGTG